MNSPDPTDPESKSIQERLLPHRRFWSWGIWFWVVAWIVSILVIQPLMVNREGRPGVKFFVGNGSIVMEINTYSTCAANYIRLEEPIFLWSEPYIGYLGASPNNFISLMGSVGWRGYVHDHSLSIPIAGFLWLWLIGAWSDGFRKFRWPRTFWCNQVIARIAILVALPLLILISDHKSRIAEQTTQCVLNIRNFQQATRSCSGMKSLNPGEPMPWDMIFGPGNFMSPDFKLCPCGQPYRLISHVPEMGELAAECPNSKHQQKMKRIDTSDW